MTFKDALYNAPTALTLGLCILVVLAFWRGSGPEKFSAIILAGMMLADDVYHAIYGPYYPLDRADPWHAFLGLIVLLSLMVVAMRANRVYPLALAAAQLVSVTAHVVRTLVEQMTTLSYFLLYATPAYFQLVILAVGLWWHIQRVKQSGPYRDWRALPPSHDGLRYS